MNVTEIANDIKDHVEQGQAWFSKILETHIPALLAEGERLPASPIVKILEKVFLPPEAEQAIADLISKFATTYAGHTAAAATPADGAAATSPAPGQGEAAPAAS